MGPSFVCIGAQKAGTTWLYRNLAAHPEVWMPPVKELHYFDRAPSYPTPNSLSVDSFVERSRDPKWMAQAISRVDKPRKEGELARAAFMARYYFSDYSDSFYLSLFEWAGHKVSGDITPSYAMLELDDVRRMRALLPEVKLIFMLRDPVERAWSYCRQVQKMFGQLDLDDVAQVLKAIDEPAQELRSDYVKTLEHYLQCFAPEKLLLVFYDAISEQPRQLMGEILEFLQLNDATFFSPELAAEVVNRSPEKPMPPEVAQHLARKYAPMKKQLAARFGGYCRRWTGETTLAGDCPASLRP